MPKRLVTVGDLVLDLLLDVRLPIHAGAHQMSPTLLLEPGGACSTIFAARNLGLDVAALGAVGDDAQGRMLHDMLGSAGVDTSALLMPPGSTTTTVVALADTKRGEHVFLGNYGAGDLISLTKVARAQLERADVVFVPGYALVEERLTALIDGLLAFLEQKPTPLYLDVGPFMGRLQQGKMQRVLALTHCLLLTEAEIPFVSHGQTGISACRRLLQSHPNLLIALKLAEKGCRIMSREVDIGSPGFPVAVVDAIGAGDAFAAAFIWSRLRGYALADCATIANAMGAASVRKAGAGRGAPSRSEIQSVLDEHNTGIQLSC